MNGFFSRFINLLERTNLMSMIDFNESNKYCFDEKENSENIINSIYMIIDSFEIIFQTI